MIGAGAGGGVAACVLAEAGRRVLLVERGESLARADLPRDHLRNARVFTGLERQVDPPDAGNPRFVATWRSAERGGMEQQRDDARRRHARVRRDGVALLPEDFRMGSTYGAPFVDWPIGYDELAPYYDRVEWELGVCGSGRAAPVRRPAQRGYPMPPFAPNAAEPVLARGAAALGIATGAIPLLINSVPTAGARRASAAAPAPASPATPTPRTGATTRPFRARSRRAAATSSPAPPRRG